MVGSALCVVVVAGALSERGLEGEEPAFSFSWALPWLKGMATDMPSEVVLGRAEEEEEDLVGDEGTLVEVDAPLRWEAERMRDMMVARARPAQNRV